MTRFPPKVNGASPLEVYPTFLDLANRKPASLKIERFPASEALHIVAFQSELNAARNAMLAQAALQQRAEMGRVMAASMATQGNVTYKEKNALMQQQAELDPQATITDDIEAAQARRQNADSRMMGFSVP